MKSCDSFLQHKTEPTFENITHQTRVDM